MSCSERIDKTPAGKFTHGLMALVAEWYSGNLSEEMKVETTPEGTQRRHHRQGSPRLPEHPEGDGRLRSPHHRNRARFERRS